MSEEEAALLPMTGSGVTAARESREGSNMDEVVTPAAGAVEAATAAGDELVVKRHAESADAT